MQWSKSIIPEAMKNFYRDPEKWMCFRFVLIRLERYCHRIRPLSLKTYLVFVDNLARRGMLMTGGYFANISHELLDFSCILKNIVAWSIQWWGFYFKFSKAQQVFKNVRIKTGFGTK